MKRILKTWILTMMFCLGSVVLFSQSAAAACASCGYHGSSYNSGYGYRHYNSGYRHHGSGYKYFNCKTYSYDGCSCSYYPVVTTYKSCVVPYRGCYTDNCCCKKWYTYYKRYTYAVKTVKYHCPVKVYNNCCNTCSY